MRSYRDLGHEPAFQVSYRFLTHAEGGRQSPPGQHLRLNFLYAGDDPQRDGVNMIWPEFLSPQGSVLPEGEVPMVGTADMFIVFPERVPFHRERISVGTKGYFVEEGRRVAECEVIAIGPFGK